MANAYGNLGIVYQDRGELDRAEDLYRKARVLFQEIRSPKEKLVDEWMRKLRNKKS